MSEAEIQELAHVLESLRYDPYVIIIPVAGFLLTIIGLHFAYKQLLLAQEELGEIKDQMYMDYERGKREFAVETLRYFHDQIRPEYDGLSRILRHCEAPDLEKLRDHEQFTIPTSCLSLLDDTLSKAFPNVTFDRNVEDGNRYILSQRESSAIRYTAVQCINLMEVTLAPVYAEIVDHDTMLEQIEPYFSGRMGTRLEGIRNAFGKEELPNTFRCMGEIAEKNKVSPGKSSLWKERES